MFRSTPMTTWPHLFIVPNFLTPAERRILLSEMKSAATSAATVYGRSTAGAIDQNVRRTLRVRPSDETVTLITTRLWSYREAVEQHFDVALSECEEPQFLRYRKGDFFVAHQDGNTGLLQLDTERRRVSTVIFLNSSSKLAEPDSYGGGSLVFTNYNDKFSAEAEPGMLIAFRSETTHEVTPVTHGERYSIASWYR